MLKYYNHLYSPMLVILLPALVNKDDYNISVMSHSRVYDGAYDRLRLYDYCKEDDLCLPTTKGFTEEIN